MTKRVRIENADTYPAKVRVRFQNRMHDDTWVDADPQHDIDLNITDLTGFYIHQNQRLIIEEVI